MLKEVWETIYFVTAIPLIGLVLCVGYITLLLGLISQRSYSWFRGVVLNSGWCFFPYCFQAHGGSFEFTRDESSSGFPSSKVILLNNHVSIVDYVAMFAFASSVDHLRHIRVLVKRTVLYVPVVGFVMKALGTVFLSRSFDRDQKTLESTFKSCTSERGYWLLVWPEGTRFTPAKQRESAAFARERGRPQPTHVLLPRVKGFLSMMDALQGDVEYVVDATIAWDHPPAPIPFHFFFGLRGANTAHVHYRWWRVSDLPVKQHDLAEWLYSRWQEKDALIAAWKHSGKFPGVALETRFDPLKAYSYVRYWMTAVACLYLFAGFMLLF